MSAGSRWELLELSDNGEPIRRCAFGCSGTLKEPLHFMDRMMRFSVDDVSLDEFVQLAMHFGLGQYGYVVTPNVDHLIRWHEDPLFRKYYADASFVLLDSRFLAHLLRLLGRRVPQVVPGSDLAAHLLKLAVRPEDPIVLIGAEETQARLLRERYGLSNLHHFNPPMGFARDEAQIAACLNFIEKHSPFKFCLLAVGSPQQEMLAQRLRTRGVARGLALCVGAAVDFLTGKEQRAPRWMQVRGLEWLYRLVRSPRRLASRYLVRGPRVFLLLSRTQLALRSQHNRG